VFLLSWGEGVAGNYTLVGPTIMHDDHGPVRKATVKQRAGDCQEFAEQETSSWQWHPV